MMPLNAASLIAVVGLVLAVMVWSKTRRIGPVAGVMLAAFIVMAITDTSVLQAGGDAVGELLTWFIDQIITID